MVIDGTAASSRMGKRIREGDDEVYLDNYYSNKRYLTEVISSCLNGLKVADVDIASAAIPDENEDFGDSLDPGAVLAKSFSSARSYLGEDHVALDSPMSDDGDEQFMSVSTSPSRSSSRSLNSSPPTSSLPRHLHESECCRLPPSPSDPCHPPDLRRAALMRALQIRALSPGGIRPSCMYDPRQLQQILDKDKPAPATIITHRRGDDQNELLLGSPPHGQFPSQVFRASNAVASRSLVLDDDQKPVESVATAEGMDRSEDVLSEPSVPRRSRSRRRPGEECHWSRMKRGKLHQNSISSLKKVEGSTEISDTESCL
ncbi:uncharacterized protein LOC112348976 [Selaginella moellendorffii]|uniref:uncharacterized protein LOC112348976 n=1 Tax=Selaginella moellendorffii TaxID=88036 RepID=UPI000D1C9C1F|nr:uncharacterized protein LOC112348976 [Selaginella moellendorffii]XP_024538242.1 uncharacterized protein LOC112348976 [Selaginella moellendorffii]|eukprot:XP_024538241.1 uncharacterized protein LOC112348976 [Selaginella moellendorffii]